MPLTSFREFVSESAYLKRKYFAASNHPLHEMFFEKFFGGLSFKPIFARGWVAA
jgi:hypothetical protein